MQPKISIIIPVYNEEKNLLRLIPSLERQTYPRRRLEYIIINDSSTDKTHSVAKRITDKLITVNNRKTVYNSIELNKSMGLHLATGDLIFWMDADMQVLNNDCIELLAKPLIENPKISGAFSNFRLSVNDGINNSLLRFISEDVIQRDPLFQLFAPSVESTVISKNKTYWTCRYRLGYIPSSGMMMYRRKQLLEVLNQTHQEFLDLASLETMVESGHNLFAFVPNARIAHFHINDLKHLISKRLRNLNKSYLANLDTPNYYKWIDLSKTSDLVKLTGWIIWANLFLPELVRGIIKAVRWRDTAFLWQPIVSIILTDVLMLGFFSSPEGKRFIYKFVSSKLNISG